MEITREQFRERAREKVKSLEFSITQTAFADSRAELEEELELARIALVSLEAEAVAWKITSAQGTFIGISSEPLDYDAVKYYEQKVEPLYSAPPAPVAVPDDVSGPLAHAYKELTPTFMRNHIDVFERYGIYPDGSAGIQAMRIALDGMSRRAAMLQGAGGNSPVIPDGWTLVPIEPTEDMIVNGFESEPDESFSDEKEWEVYDAMSGCQQAAHRAKLCWAAMIASAPKV
ncbi:hypothetical protein [Escherichia coli]|uniref:hypothetical protein n=1 Tax=Escherichia coli TaxID=562 RepID=UPI00201D8712|nr:hypothetical protein [Escherichia coli]